MVQYSTGLTVLACLWTALSAEGFAPPSATCGKRTATTASITSTSLQAIGVLAKKAKQAALKEYVSGGIEDEVMEIYKSMKENMKALDSGDSSDDSAEMGPLQQAITKRKGTITVIAEFKRTTSDPTATNGMINEVYDAEFLSPTFREYGAVAAAVMADERMGGCSYKDLAAFVEEQRRAQNEVPGPIPVVNNDLIIDELQIARTKKEKCAACVIPFSAVSLEEFKTLMKAAKAVDLEVIVAVSNAQDGQTAIDEGARMISIVQVDSVDEKVELLEQLQSPEGQKVSFIANVQAKNDKQLKEIEETWALRDKGFNAVWVGEALYKSGSDFTETPGAIIKAMRSKSSLKWASPKASGGRGEGAREYLGDIMM